jgi:hypothetical protein
MSTTSKPAPASDAQESSKVFGADSDGVVQIVVDGEYYIVVRHSPQCLDLFTKAFGLELYNRLNKQIDAFASSNLDAFDRRLARPRKEYLWDQHTEHQEVEISNVVSSNLVSSHKQLGLKRRVTLHDNLKKTTTLRWSVNS